MLDEFSVLLGFQVRVWTTHVGGASTHARAVRAASRFPICHNFTGLKNLCIRKRNEGSKESGREIGVNEISPASFVLQDWARNSELRGTNLFPASA